MTDEEIIECNGYIYRRYPPEFKLGHKSRLPFYKRWFCKHKRFSNHCEFRRFPDISFHFCDDCDQWIRQTYPGDGMKLLKEMFK